MGDKNSARRGSLINPNDLKKQSLEAKQTENLTGGQIQDILDTLILESVRPIVLFSTVFSQQISHLLVITTKNRKRKLSALPREEAILLMYQYLTTQDRDRRALLLANMKLERGFIYNFVVNFLKEVLPYQKLYQEYLTEDDPHSRNELDKKLSLLESSVGCDRNHMFQMINCAQDYLEQAYIFRNSIVLKYLKHAYKQACSFVKMRGKNFDLEDVYQNFLAAVTKAIDKYDSSKGALTSYINFWLQNAQATSKNSHGHEYNIAYTIPQLQKKLLTGKNKKGEVNFGVSLDSALSGSSAKGQEGDSKGSLKDVLVGSGSAEDDLLEDEALTEVKILSKKADPGGIARLYLNIDEWFSKKEKKKMLRTMRNQLGLAPVLHEGKISYTVALEKSKPNPRQSEKISVPERPEIREELEEDPVKYLPVLSNISQNVKVSVVALRKKVVKIGSLRQFLSKKTKTSLAL